MTQHDIHVLPPLENLTPAAGSGGVRTGRRFRIGPNLVLVFCALFFTLPLLAMARFALQNVPVILLNWSTVFDKWSLSDVFKAFGDEAFRSALKLSLKLALGTVLLTLGLLMPTAIWVHLRLPRARAFIEFLTVLPYVIPAIALVAGIKIIQPHIRWFLNSEYSLIPFYMVLALPFTYRSLDAGIRALDLRTLVDASRSLGAGWGTTLRRALVPNLRTAIISSAFLTTAVVLGEYTIANVLLRDTLPTFTAIYRGPEPRGSYGLALLTLVATTGLFALLSVLTRRRTGKTTTPITDVIGLEPAAA
jgi:putative spermidine/putrescine transport system permease protein